MATAKHFAAYGAAESGRDYNVADVSERTMWEVYLPPFEAAVRAGAASLMASFNEIGGTPAHASEWLLDDVLRRRWGFRGLVVSDWTGVEELLKHGIAAERWEAASRALGAGVDVEMSSTTYNDLAPAVQGGRFPVAEIDSAVLRVLRAKVALGLFDDPYRYSDTVRERAGHPDGGAPRRGPRAGPQGDRAAQERARRRSPTLPLRKDLRSVAVIGPLADDARSSLGSWAGAGRPEDAITLVEGIRRALPQARVVFARGAPVDTVDTGGFAEAQRAAREADAVLLVLGERENMSAEAASRASVELPGSQEALARAVVAAARESGAGKPVVALLMNGRPLAIPWLADSVSAILETWYLGVEHGPAVADVLFGDHNPSGKLPVSFPRATGQVPIYYDRKPTGRPPVASERYTSKYLDVHWTPQWPFGHGLSYTQFAYDSLRLSADSLRMGDSLAVTVSVRNTGDRPGDEIVQLYVRDDAASVTRPLRALKGFARISLQPGEARDVRLMLRPADLSLYDLDDAAGGGAGELYRVDGRQLGRGPGGTLPCSG